MLPRTDIWRVGLLRQPIGDIFARGSLEGIEPVWLPVGRSWSYIADPFGLWREDRLYLFAEAYDYRNKRGRIVVLMLDRDLNLIDHQPCLSQPWHLSYPYLIEQGDEVYMLPEAFRSGTLTLYRATRFPFAWEPVAAIPLDGAAIDASPVFHDGLWWLFHAPSTDRTARMGVLHLAWAERLTGPWHLHPLNPLRSDLSGARPAGSPTVVDGKLIVPLQDCSRTYGGAVKLLRVEELSPTRFEAEICAAIAAPRAFAPWTQGLHTLSGCGDITLFDAKRILRSPGKWAIDAGRELGKVRATPGWR
jgi:hypothetical protein